MIIAVRHGPVAAAGLCYGRWDPPLVRRADEDAALILARLGTANALPSSLPTPYPRRIVSSPAGRCLTVAAILAPHLGATLDVDDRLAELSMGEWEGRAWTEIEAVDGARLAAWMDRWESDAAPGGETIATFESRVRAAAVAVTEPVIWLTHAGVIRSLRVLHGGLTWGIAMRGTVAHLEPERFVTTGPPTS